MQIIILISVAVKRLANLGPPERALEELGGIPSAVGVADINDWLAERVIRRKTLNENVKPSRGPRWGCED
jgi:hypothetical protein